MQKMIKQMKGKGKGKKGKRKFGKMLPGLGGMPPMDGMDGNPFGM